MLETVKKCTCQGSNIQELKKFKGILFLQTCSSSLSSLIRKSSSNRFASALLHSEASVGIWSRWIWCLDRKIWVKVNWLVSILQLGHFINVRCIINWTAFFFFYPMWTRNTFLSSLPPSLFPYFPFPLFLEWNLLFKKTVLVFSFSAPL